MVTVKQLGELLPRGPPPAYRKGGPRGAEVSTWDLCKGLILAWVISWPVRQMAYSHPSPKLLRSNPKGTGS